MTKILYHENQRMLQPWIAAILCIAMLALECLIVADYLGYTRIDADSQNILVVILVSAVVVFVILLALFLRMDVTVTEDELLIKTVRTRRIARSGIESVAVRDRIYAVREYGGWGIRLWTKGLGYIAPGNNGGVEVRIEGRSKGIMVSSRTPDDLYCALN